MKFPLDKSTSFLCPVCKQPMRSQRGHQVDANDGFTVFCANADCDAQEVSGHGNTEKAAAQIIREKFVDRESRQ